MSQSTLKSGRLLQNQIDFFVKQLHLLIYIHLYRVVEIYVFVEYAFHPLHILFGGNHVYAFKSANVQRLGKLTL